jgi:DNA ligase D-like protein (predicted 3'-phosphoesterase)
MEEVPGREVMKKKPTLFVIQKHQATHLHYDLRLEMDGVLKSWAVPKRPPVKKNIKRLAIQTEDHALDYARVEGVFSEGDSRVETVEIWDTGTYLLEGRGRSIIVVHFKGKKLKGRYCLVRFKGQKKNWLFFKC